MPIELAQVKLLQLPAPGAMGVQEVKVRCDRYTDHRRPTGLVPRCAALHQRVPLGHRLNRKRAVCRLVVLLRLSAPQARCVSSR